MIDQIFGEIIKEMVYNPVRYTVIVLIIGFIYFALFNLLDYLGSRHKKMTLLKPTPSEHQVTKEYVDNNIKGIL